MIENVHQYMAARVVLEVDGGSEGKETKVMLQLVRMALHRWNIALACTIWLLAIGIPIAGGNAALAQSARTNAEAMVDAYRGYRPAPIVTAWSARLDERQQMQVRAIVDAAVQASGQEASQDALVRWIGAARAWYLAHVARRPDQPPIDHVKRIRALDPKVLDEWTTAAAASAAALDERFLAALAIAFHDGFWIDSGWGPDQPRSMLSRLRGISREDAASWAKAAGERFLPYVPLFSLLSVDALYSGNVFDRNRFRSALAEVPKAWAGPPRPLPVARVAPSATVPAPVVQARESVPVVGERAAPPPSTPPSAAPKPLNGPEDGKVEVAAAAPAPAPATAPAATAAGLPPAQEAAFELAHWDAVKDSKNPEELRTYLAQYPNGRFAKLAELRIAALEAAIARGRAGPIGGAGAESTITAPGKPPAQASAVTPSAPASTGPPAAAGMVSPPRPGDTWTYTHEDRIYRRGQRSRKSVVTVSSASGEGIVDIAQLPDGVHSQATFPADRLRVVVRDNWLDVAPYLLSTITPTIDAVRRSPVEIVGSPPNQITDRPVFGIRSARYVGTERVTVAAGVFDAVRVDVLGTYDDISNAGTFAATPPGELQISVWYSTQVKRSVRTHIVGRRGTLNVSIELESYRVQ